MTRLAGRALLVPGEHFEFEDITLSPGAHRPDGPRLWFGGQGMSRRCCAGWCATATASIRLGVRSEDDVQKIAAAMATAGRDVADLEFIGGTRAVFPDDDSIADIGEAMEPIRGQLEAGFTTFCVKPSQFIDDVGELPDFCRDVVRRVEEMTS